MDIFNHHKIAQKIRVQKIKEWNLSDINWEMGIDLSKPFLPFPQHPNLSFASEEDSLVFSQYLGLIGANSIGSFEKAGHLLKPIMFDKILDKYPVGPEFREMGEQFFAEEVKHSKMFDRYIDTFADTLGISPEELRGVLPSADPNWEQKIYHLNSLVGGRAAWWLVVALEEVSILVYHLIRKAPMEVDPLTYEIHKLHFEEEIRHKSFAHMMLELLDQFSPAVANTFFNKVDFILMEVLHISWSFRQLAQSTRLRKLKDAHPFFERLWEIQKKLAYSSPLKTFNFLFSEAPYISHTFHLDEFRHVRKLLTEYGSYKLPLPKTKGHWGGIWAQ